jgi:ankyrin repeat protein
MTTTEENNIMKTYNTTAYPGELIFAIKRGHSIEKIGELIGPVEETGDNLDIPLNVACKYRRPKLVKLLLEAGADVHFNGEFPLMGAVSNGRAENVRLLLAAGARTSAISKDQIELAKRRGYTEIVALLETVRKNPEFFKRAAAAKNTSYKRYKGFLFGTKKE